MKRNHIILASFLLIASLTSCSSVTDDLLSTTQPGDAQPAKVNLLLTTGAIAGGTSRTTGALPTADGSSTATQSGENTVQRVCVGIFDINGNTLAIKEIAGPSSYTQESDSKYWGNLGQITTTTAAAEVIVVANYNPVATPFTGAIPNKTAFLSQTTFLTYTSSVDGNASYAQSQGFDCQKQTALPMVGHLSIAGFTKDATGTYVATAKVELARMVSRIAITKITSSPNTMKIVPIEIFAFRANTATQFFYDGTSKANMYIPSYCWNGSNNFAQFFTVLCPEGTYLNGTSYVSKVANGADNPQKITGCNYLSTGLISYTNTTTNTNTETVPGMDWLGGVNTERPYPTYFYVFPNDGIEAATSTIPTTRLVVKAWYYPTLTSTPVMRYYPIRINHLQKNTTITVTPKGETAITYNGNDATIWDSTNKRYLYADQDKILSNWCYNVQVTISGEGVTDPNMDLDPADVKIVVTIADWEPLGTQTVNFY